MSMLYPIKGRLADSFNFIYPPNFFAFYCDEFFPNSFMFKLYGFDYSNSFSHLLDCYI